MIQITKYLDIHPRINWDELSISNMLLIKEIQHISVRVCEKNCVDEAYNKGEFYQQNAVNY